MDFDYEFLSGNPTQEDYERLQTQRLVVQRKSAEVLAGLSREPGPLMKHLEQMIKTCKHHKHAFWTALYADSSIPPKTSPNHKKFMLERYVSHRIMYDDGLVQQYKQSIPRVRAYMHESLIKPAEQADLIEIHDSHPRLHELLTGLFRAKRLVIGYAKDNISVGPKDKGPEAQFLKLCRDLDSKVKALERMALRLKEIKHAKKKSSDEV